ncbi:leader peptidase (prepilin peptidase)/N-methyltransferase [Saccharothrix carnea]|uniref:Leader peptidase (Prepilin peptidase)/N-methyltransferase n=1 Tax=Saccharothrix carnea TaxID=1280637 RepID=A0A2P8I379_SACCR|nr:A24 family peptidase [Saccharothrix carnea]PSL52927.1 leader peptidase (prepilin peptidase)/N-methyltransferase [Saccharothrix carnea]
MVISGFLAGAVGAGLLRRLPRGADVCWLWCAVPTAVLWFVAWALASPPWLPVPLLLAWLGVLLTATDLRHRRLPDALTLPAYPVIGVALWWCGADLWRALAGCLLFGGFHLLVRLLAPAAMGGGDVKLAGPLGAVLASASWFALPVAAVLASLVTLVLSLWWPDHTVPHGPGLLAGTWALTVSGG